MGYDRIKINGETLMVWPLEGKQGFSISDNGGWIVGSYDSRETAIEAFKLSQKPNGHGILAGISKRVNHIDSENRDINMSDLIEGNKMDTILVSGEV